MRLIARIEGATDQDREKAEAAAWQVFETARIHPIDAASAVFKMEGEQEDLTEQEHDLVELWFRAQTAAAEAVGADEAVLELDVPRVR